jgi:Leucine-rich repeat (LRR) protein
MSKSTDQTVMICQSDELKQDEDVKRDVTILFPNSDSLTLTVTSKDTIRDIKQSITSTHGISIGNFQLFQMDTDKDTDKDTDVEPLANNMLVSSLITNNMPLNLALILTTDRDVVLEILRLNPHIKNQVNWEDDPELLSDWTDIKVDPNKLESITTLNLPACGLSRLPESLNNLTSLTHLYLYTNRLTELPELSNMTSLTTLDLNYNQLTKLPDLSNLSKLSYLNVSRNQLTELPDLSNLTKLELIWVSNNQLTKLPNISNLTSLRSLYTSHNQLTEIPSRSNLPNLKYLDTSHNPINKI